MPPMPSERAKARTAQKAGKRKTDLPQRQSLPLKAISAKGERPHFAHRRHKKEFQAHKINDTFHGTIGTQGWRGYQRFEGNILKPVIIRKSLEVSL
jgi:hypothetical protein